MAKFVEDIIVPPRMIDIVVDGEVFSFEFCFSLLLFLFYNSTVCAPFSYKMFPYLFLKSLFLYYEAAWTVPSWSWWSKGFVSSREKNHVFWEGINITKKFLYLFHCPRYFQCWLFHVSYISYKSYYVLYFRYILTAIHFLIPTFILGKWRILEDSWDPE